MIYKPITHIQFLTSIPKLGSIPRLALTFVLALFLVQGVLAATITVNTTDDELNTDGDCSLREAIQAAKNDSTEDSCDTGSGDDTIEFDSSLDNQTITLSSSQLIIETNLTIDATALSSGISISGGNNVRVFEIISGSTVTIKGVAIKDGNTSSGGGIYNNGTLLTLKNTTLSNNQITGNGGAIFNNSGTVELINSTISGNTSTGSNGVGGIQNKDTLKLINCTISNNKSENAAGRGVGIRNFGGTTTIKNTIIAGNLNKNSETEDCINSGGTITSEGYNLIGSNDGSNPSGDCPYNSGNGDILVTSAALSNEIDSFDTSKNVYPLKDTSPNALNAIPNGTNGCGTSPLDRDQLGTTRPQENKCDIGAYEKAPSTSTLTVTSSNGKVTEGANIDCDNNAGTCSADYNIGTEVTLTASTPANGYAFKEWSGDCGSDGKVTMTVGGNNCTATFAQVFTLTVTQPTEGGKITGLPGPTDGADGIDCGSECTEEYFNEEITLTAVPDPDYAIENWTDDCATNNDGTVTLDADKTCSVTFVPTNNNLTITSPDDGKVTATGIDCGSTGGTDCEEGYANNTTEVTLTAVPDTNYVIHSWGGDCSDFDSETGKITVSGEKTCSVDFAEARTLTITAPAAAGNQIQGPKGPMATTGTDGFTCDNGGADCTEVYANGKTVTLTAIPNTGQALDSWGDDCNSTGQVTLTGGDKICSATFDTRAYTLTVTEPSNGKVTASGIDCGSGATDCEEYYTNTHTGSTITLTPTPDTDYELSSWGDDCNSDGQVVLDATTKICSVTFTKKPFVTLGTTGTGSGTVSGGGFYSKNSTVNLTATPDANSTFAGWSSGCASSFTITTDMNCTATFNQEDTGPPPPEPPPPLPQTLNFSVKIEGAGNGTITFSDRNDKVEIEPNETDCDTEENECTYIFDTATWITFTFTPDDNSIFTYWTGSSDCNKGDFDEDGGKGQVFITSNLYCIAHLKLKPHTLGLNYQGDGNGTVSISPTGKSATCAPAAKNCWRFDGGLEVTLTPTPDQWSYFDKWTGDEDCNDATVEMLADKTCVAHFALLPTYQLTMNYEGTGKGTVTRTPPGKDCQNDGKICTYSEGTEVILTPEPEQISSTFTGWSENCSGSADSQTGQITMTSDQNCTATFTQKPIYHLTITKDGNGDINFEPPGTDCGNNCKNYFANTMVTLKPILGSGSKGAIFGDGCTDGQIMLDTNKHCTVLFTQEEIPDDTPDDPSKPKTYALYVIRDGEGQIISDVAGINCGNDCSENFEQGKMINLTAKEESYYSKFGSWSQDCPNGQVVMDGNKVCTVTFDPIYTLMVKKDGTGKGNITSSAGINCGEDCTANHPRGTEIQLVATPTADSSFAGWSHRCPNGKVTLDSSKICTATFTVKPVYRLKVNLAGAGKGLVNSPSEDGIECGRDCSELYLAEDKVQVTLVPMATPGSFFLGWQGDCNDKGQVLMDANRQCTAVFDSSGIVQFAHQATQQVDEGTGTVTFTVSRIGGTYGEVSVDYATQDGTAIAEKEAPATDDKADYQASIGKLTWANGENQDKSITVAIMLDKETEEPETFSLLLSNPGGGINLGTPHQLNVTIMNAPWASLVQFAMPNYALKENGGKIKLVVTRAGSSQSSISVDYTTKNGTATSSDYTPVSGTLRWDSGDSKPKFIEVPVLTDKLEEPEETFMVTLANPSEDTQLGSKPQATVTITAPTVGGNNDGSTTPSTGEPPNSETGTNPPPESEGNLSPSLLQLNQSRYDINESDREVVLFVTRTNSSQGIVTVNYTTQNNTAVASKDYQPSQGELQWADGESGDKSISIAILDDTIIEDDKRFMVTLSEPTGNATLVDDNASAMVNIQDDDSSMISLSSELYEAEEGDAQINVILYRTGGYFEQVSVDYATSDGTATAGEDYTATNGTVILYNGETQATLTIPLLLDNLDEGTETLQLSFSNVSDNAILGTINQATLIISDTDTSDCKARQKTQPIIDCLSINDDSDEPLQNIHISKEGTVVGGKLGGQIQNQGSVQNVTLLPTTKVIGGNISGNIEGDAEQPAILTAVTIEADATLRNVVIGKNSVIASKAVLKTGASLQNAKISSQGIVSGGTVQGDIQIEAGGQLQDVTLKPSAKIQGGTLSGKISGDSAQPVTAILQDVKIAEGSSLQYVVIGTGAELDDSNIQLGEGVRFATNSLIPEDIELGTLLGLHTNTVFGQNAVLLTDDVLYNDTIGGSASGILGAINGLPHLKNFGWELTQEPETGYLILEIENLRYAVLPTQVRQVLRKQMAKSIPSGMTVDHDGTVIFITHTGREVIAQPVVQAPQALNNALRKLGLNQVIMLENGNLKIPTTNGYYFMARASLFATQVEMPLGLVVNELSVSLVFEKNGNHYQQLLYPAAAAPEALHALSENNPPILLNNDGRITAQIGNQKYQGLLDYIVTTGQSRTAKLQFHPIADKNNDGCNDYRIDYPNGDSQILFCLQ